MQLDDLREAIASHPGLTQTLEAVFEKGAVLAGFQFLEANRNDGAKMDFHVLICDGPTNHLFGAIVKAMQEAQQKYNPPESKLITQ